MKEFLVTIFFRFSFKAYKTVLCVAVQWWTHQPGLRRIFFLLINTLSGNAYLSPYIIMYNIPALPLNVLISKTLFYTAWFYLEYQNENAGL